MMAIFSTIEILVGVLGTGQFLGIHGFSSLNYNGFTRFPNALTDLGVDGQR